MSIHVDWGNHEETIVVWKFSREWESKDYMQALSKTSTLLRHTTQNINLICDIRLSVQRASNLLVLARLVTQHRPPHIGVMTIIVANEFWKNMADILTRQRSGRPLPVYFVETVDEAYDLVGANDEFDEPADSG